MNVIPQPVIVTKNFTHPISRGIGINAAIHFQNIAIMTILIRHMMPTIYPCAASIALLGQLFIHLIQLSQRYDQNGRLSTVRIAFTGQLLMQRSHLSQFSLA